MKRRRILRTMLSVVVLLVVLYSALGVYAKWRAYKTRKNAEIFLGEVQNLRPGKATLADVERLARMQNQFLMKGSHYWDKCALNFDFQYDNALLSHLYLATPTSLTAYLCVGDGTLRFTGVSLVSLPRSPPGVLGQASLSDWSVRGDPENRTFRRVLTNLAVFVALRPGATPEQIRQAYSFNLKCLDKIGGCHSNAELFFGPW